MKSDRSLLVFFALVVYFLSILFAYRFFMLNEWGRDFLETSWGGGGLGDWQRFSLILTFLGASYALSKMKNTPSDFLYLMFFMVPITPMFVISMWKATGLLYMNYVMIAFVVSFFVSKVKFNLINVHSSYQYFSEIKYIKFCIALGLVIVSLCIVRGGLGSFNLDFSDVYEYRRAGSSSRGVLLNYLLLNYIGLLLGIACALCIKRRERRYLGALITINILLFGLTSNKSYLFVSLMTLAMSQVVKVNSPKFIFIISLSLICIVFTSLYIFFPEFESLTTMLVRRFLFVPSYANLIYADFFSSSPFVYWSDSTIGFGIADSPYGGLPTPQVIANEYSGVDMAYRTEQYNNLNTGWLGSGYANAGPVGMFVYAILSGLILKYVNVLGTLLGPKTALAGVSFYFFTIFFTSTDLPAALLSYGFFSTFIIFMFWKRPR